MKTLICFFVLSLCISNHGWADELQGKPAVDIIDLATDDPYQGPYEQAVGFYSNGKLLHPHVLPLEGFGFVKLFRPRNRGYGTYDLVTLLQEAATKLQLLHPSRDRLQLGDTSQFSGGSISGHASHQNGLDADVAFLRVDQTEQDPSRTDGFREHFVNNQKLTANFDLRRNWDLAKILISTGRVQRLLVGEVIRNEMCRYVKSIGELSTETETMRRLRPVPGHTGHMHIRLTCPQNSANCKAQEEVPVSPNCQ